MLPPVEYYRKRVLFMAERKDRKIGKGQGNHNLLIGLQAIS
jgi:hypothetical protein